MAANNSYSEVFRGVEYHTTTTTTTISTTTDFSGVSPVAAATTNSTATFADAAADTGVSATDGAMLLKDALELVSLCLISNVDPQNCFADRAIPTGSCLLHSVVDAIVASLFQLSWVDENRENIRAEVDCLVGWILLQLVRVPRFTQQYDHQVRPCDNTGTSTAMKIDDCAFRDSLETSLRALLNCMLVRRNRLVVKRATCPSPRASNASNAGGYIVRVGRTKRFFPYA